MERREFLLFAGSSVAALTAGRIPGAAAATWARTGAFLTEPDWSPAPLVVNQAPAGTAPGLLFAAPFDGAATTSSGPYVFDDTGQPVWLLPLQHVQAQNLRVQTYLGRPMLTWYEGPAATTTSTYGGTCVIYDPTYHEVKRVHGGNGYSCDLHEFVITSRGTALLSIAGEVAVGGQKVVEGIVQEIEIETGKVLLEWHSLDHVPLSDSYRGGVTSAGNVDYFHLNSIGVDLDGGLLVSARHTATVYKLDRTTGRVLWRLGGKHSDFRLGPGARFWFQHDARRHSDGTLTVFDNGATDGENGAVEPASRPLRLGLDLSAMTADVVRVYTPPTPRLAISMGNVQVLPDGGVFVGWGILGAFTEFAPDGAVRYDAQFADGSQTYRAFRLPWTAQPGTLPAIAVAPGPSVHASWNGATDVAAWEALAGAAPSALRSVARAPRSGFETAIPLAARSGYVAVAALDASGRRLATSQTVRL